MYERFVLKVMAKLSKLLCVAVPHHLADQLKRCSATVKPLEEDHTSAATNDGFKSDITASNVEIPQLITKAVSLKDLRANHNLKLTNCWTSVSNDSQLNQQRISSLEIQLGKIVDILRDNISKEERHAEWIWLGTLIDRILLVILIVATATTAIYIYTIIPSTLN